MTRIFVLILSYFLAYTFLICAIMTCVSLGIDYYHGVELDAKEFLIAVACFAMYHFFRWLGSEVLQKILHEDKT